MKASRTVIAALPMLGSLALGSLALGFGLTAPASAATTPVTTGTATHGQGTPAQSIPAQGVQAQDPKAQDPKAQGQQAQSQGAQAPKALRPVVVTCGKAKVTRPRDFWLSCGDSTFFLFRLTWSSWKLDHAAGSGRVAENDCTPDCANGKWHDYPVKVAFKGSVRVYGHPSERRYTSYTLTFTGKRPPEQQTATYNGSLWP